MFYSIMTRVFSAIMKTGLIFLTLFSTIAFSGGSLYDHSNDQNNKESVIIEPNVTQKPPHHLPPEIRVASWNYHHVKPYLLTTVFLIIVALCKLGKYMTNILIQINFLIYCKPR